MLLEFQIAFLMVDADEYIKITSAYTRYDMYKSVIYTERNQFYTVIIS